MVNHLVFSIQLPYVISVIQINAKQGSIRMIEANALTLADKKPPADKKRFHCQVVDTIQQAMNPIKIILFRDMNSRLGAYHANWPKYLSGFGVGKINDINKRFLELCPRNIFCLTNIFSFGKLYRMMFWCHFPL